jgi:hypothetical protein
MASDSSALPHTHHPSPYRARVSIVSLLFAAWAGPLAWAAQLIANYALAAYPCFSAGVAHAHVLANWRHEWPLLLAINLVALLLSLSGAALSARFWQATRGEHEGEAGHALDAGEGRTRFLALCGLMTGLGFFGAILFNTVGLFLVPQCAG